MILVGTLPRRLTHLGRQLLSALAFCGAARGARPAQECICHKPNRGSHRDKRSYEPLRFLRTSTVTSGTDPMMLSTWCRQTPRSKVPSPVHSPSLGETPCIPCATFSYRLLRSEEHTSELQSLRHLVCRLLLEKKMIEVVCDHLHRFA